MSDILSAWKKEGLIQSQTEQNRKRRKREGRGNKCKKKKKGDSDVQGLYQFLSTGNKNIVFVNGSWGALTHGECSEEAGSLACICSWALALSISGVLQSLMRISQRYDFRRLSLGRIWMCCHFWLSSACDVEAPLGCCLSPLFPSLCSVWAMVLSGGKEHHLTDGGLPQLKGGLNL